MTERITRQEKLDHGNRILLDKNLSPVARLVGWYVTDHINWKRGYAWPSQEDTARDLGICERAVRNAIKDLAPYFVVDRSRRAHEYRMATPAKNAAIAANDTGKIFHDTGTGCTSIAAQDVPPSFEEPLNHPLNARTRAKRSGNRQEKPEAEFEEFWRAKPSRGKNQANPKTPARLKFISLVRNGIDPQKIIAAAKEWARQEKANGNLETRFVATAVVWLNQKRFNDYAENLNGPTAVANGGFVAPPGSAQFNAWKAHCTDNYNDPICRSLKRELENHELSGKPFDFQTEWPPEPPRGQNK